MKMTRMFRGLLTLSCSLVVTCVETIQSQIEYDLAANEIMVDPTTSTPPWPKLYLDDPSESPEDPSVTFKPHRPPPDGHSPTPSPLPQALDNPENITEMITEPIRVYNDDTAQYVRYMLPYQNSEENTIFERSDATYRKPSKIKQKPKRYRSKNRGNKPRKPVNLKDSTVVSIPKIYVDMAFTGHYSKISVPLSRIRKSEKKVPGEVQLLLPKTALMPRSQSRMDSDLRPPATSGILTFPKQLIVDGVTNIKYANDRNDGVWPFRMMRGVRNSVRSWTDGLFNFFRRRSFTPVMPTLPSFSLPFTSNNLDTLYRPETWELDDPYTRKRKDRYHQQVVDLFDANRRNYKRMSSTGSELSASGSELQEVAKPLRTKRRNFKIRPNSELVVSATEVKPRVVKANKSKSNYDHSAWKPVARPHSPSKRLEEQEEREISERSYWKRIPQFLTSSNNTMDTFHWRSYPLLSNRRSDGKKVETGYWVPGSPGPLVWGDLLGKLETEQKKYQEAFPIKLNITARDP